MKRLGFALVFLLLTILWSSEALADKYRVYCANGKIEVDTRDVKQMKSARGSSIYMLGEFDYRTEAVEFAKKFGGVGAQCKK